MDTAKPDTIIRTLYQEHYAEVLAYCVRRIGHDEADDVASEVFATAWRRIEELRPETARPWLYGIARRTLSNRWRSSLRYRRVKEKVGGLAPSHFDTPEVFIVRREEDREVVECLQKLKASDREILMLSAWEQLTAPEIAIALDLSVSAVEQRIHRAKRRFADVLEDSGQDSKVSPRAAFERGER